MSALFYTDATTLGQSVTVFQLSVTHTDVGPLNTPVREMTSGVQGG